MGTLFLRPNTVALDRRGSGSQSATGETVVTVTQTNAAVPAIIDAINRGIESYQGADGLTFIEQYIFIMDGLRSNQYTAVPGSKFSQNGVTYTVAKNGKGAYPDLQVNDRVTDEEGTKYLVVSVMRYYDTVPTVEAKIVRGPSW